MLDWLTRLLPGPASRIDTLDGLGSFISRHSLFIAQKCADSYCRAKTGLSHFALAEEAAYQNALAVCRWEGYAAMLAAVSAVAQRFLMEAGGDPARIEAALVDLCRRKLAEEPPPAHRPQGWEDVLGALPERLRWARGEPPPPLAAVSAHAAKRLFDVLPIHANHRELDDEVVINSVQFQFVGLSDRMRRELDAKALVRALDAAP